MTGFYTLLCISLGYYGVVLLLLRSSILNSNSKTNSNNSISVSVIVAVRNGTISLPILLNDFTQQTYSGEMEFIIVDDESTDGTAKIIREYSEIYPTIKYMNSSSGDSALSHKKRALDAGINYSSGEILLFTDVDCRVPNKWVQSMVSYFSADVDYVIGNSQTPDSVNWISSFQQMDYLMLMSAACGSVNRNWYWSSTGQNQAYRKCVYDDCGGFTSLSKYLQGDDSLFLQICRRNIEQFKAVFVYEKDATVTCRKETKIISLLKQRIRWSGDARYMWKFNPVFFTMVVATFLSNLLIMTSLILVFLDGSVLPILVTSLLIKLLIEYLFMKKGQLLFNQQLSFFKFFLWFLPQIPYVVIMGLGSFFTNNISWRKQ